jgi:enamine deaminase RidA (YjgF/YER057c/UK114 family)
MKKKIFQWLGREFVALSCEGKKGEGLAKEAEDLFRRCDEDLRGMGLSLENTVRTRLWATDHEARHEASDVRFRVLTGKAKASSSSFISQEYFASDARVGLDLIAMRPSRPGLEKTVVEYDIPRRPCRYIIYDALVFLTGEEAKTALQPPVLADQLAHILSLHTGSLAHAGVSWNQVVKVSSFLDRTQKLETLKGLFETNLKVKIPQMDYTFVDGFAPQAGKPADHRALLEVEVTAKID